MVPETTQPTLLERVRNSADHAAWREFDRKYHGLILSYCSRRGLQASDAEDVRQVVMLSMARALRGFEYQPEKGRFRDYLGRSVRNAILAHARSPTGQPRALESGELIELVPEEGSPLTDGWETEWTLHHYRLALASIRRLVDPSSIEAFESLLAGRSVAQVAASLDMSQAAVYKVKQRMRDRFKELIARQIHDEDLGPR